MTETDGTMKFKDLFTRDLDRKVNGVIKAADDSDLSSEVDEYVLTNEIQINLDRFFDNYNDLTNHTVNGVWISGFFGSGKSHMLKMLSHIIGEVPEALVDHGDKPRLSRRQIVESFVSKAEDADNQQLAGAIEHALTIPATSILFNVDSKADKDSRSILLEAFVRVFNEACGYYGKRPEIAQFERDLDRNKLFEPFKKRFQELTQKQWDVEGREEALLLEDDICEAYKDVTGKPLQDNILERYEDTYSVTIDDFTDEVRDWLDNQEQGHRIIFLADEIGQFIGRDTQLMLSLQTIAENLGAKTAGRAWVVVTSQEEMDEIIGDLTKQQANDFSKIQGRFAVKLKLNSRDVVEVIQKRLLTKTDAAMPELEKLWDAQHENLHTLFDFSGKTEKFSRNEAYQHGDFIASYPFVNYEFELFQSALRQMSKYHVLEGTQSSIGERSMLSTISSTLRDSKAEHIGCLIPFDKLYDGISDAIKSTVNYRIHDAQARHDNDEWDLAVRILKALLLVKYVPGFHATIHDLRILLTYSFDTPVTEFEHNIAKSLKALESETYIQRTGDEYEYLTNEEQDVEQEIKNVEIDDSEITKSLAEIIRETLNGGKVLYGPQKAPFSFAISIDRVAQTTPHDICLNVATGWFSMTMDEARRATLGERNAITLMLDDSDSNLPADMRMYRKSEKYFRMANTNRQSATKQRIISERKANAEATYQELRARIIRSIESSQFIYNGENIQVKSTEAGSRLEEGLGILISRYYTNFGMLDGVRYEDSSLNGIIQESAQQDTGMLEGTNAVNDKLTIPANDVLAHIKREIEVKNTNPTVRQLVTTYSTAPYGWPEQATLACIGKLFGSERIELSLDSKPVQRTEVAAFLTNRRKQDGILVFIPRTFDAAKVSRLRKFAREFLDLSASDLSSVPLDMAETVKTKLADKADEITRLQAANNSYGFMKRLSEPVERVRHASRQDNAWLLDEFTTDEGEHGSEQLLDDKDDLIDPITQFVRGAQSKVLDNCLTWLGKNQPNAAVLSNDIKKRYEQARLMAEDPEIFRGGRVSRLKTDIDQLGRDITSDVEKERDNALTMLTEIKSDILASEEYIDANEAAQHQAVFKLDAIRQSINSTDYIPAIKQSAQTLKEQVYPQLLNLLASSKRDQPSTATNNSAHNAEALSETEAHTHALAETAAPDNPPAQRIHLLINVSISSIPIPHNCKALASESDVDSFLEDYRSTLMTAIKEGKKILL